MPNSLLHLIKQFLNLFIICNRNPNFQATEEQLMHLNP